MLTQPSAKIQTTSFDPNGQPVETWAPIPRNLWQNFSTEAQAQSALAAVQKLSPNAYLYDGLNVDAWIPVEYVDDGTNTKIWSIGGTYQASPSGPAMAIDEYAGDLFDRKVHPNPFYDKPPCVNIHAYPVMIDGVSAGIVDLYWGA